MNVQVGGGVQRCASKPQGSPRDERKSSGAHQSARKNTKPDRNGSSKARADRAFFCVRRMPPTWDKGQPMNATVGDMIEILETIAPSELAEEWDNSGLQVGARHWPVKKIRVALDPGPEVVLSACRENADLLVTHHPLIFRPLRRIDAATPVGRTLAAALAHKMAVVAVHTNLDIARGGLNDLLAKKIGLEHISGLDTRAEQQPGIGRIGDLPLPLSLSDLVRQIKDRMGLIAVRMAGDPALAVTRVAVCTGSGGSLMSTFFASDAQAFVSGDLRYHDARDAESVGRGLIDIGHFGSEYPMIGALAGLLREAVEQRGFSAVVEECRTEKDPFRRL